MKINKPKTYADWAVCALAILLVLLGLPLLIMGVQLLVLGGSAYYALAGAAIIVSGGLMLAGSVKGVWLYLMAVALTWPWAFWEVGTDVWALLPRVFGPSLLAIAVALTIPVFHRRDGEKTVVTRKV
ncbi:hypothetical protein [Novacetimonas hansenii]|uniref:hypothetical protein n=1 Tax=Novacetimonas hansenii TaxID=436 RepID=UPI00079A8708|nr:hypothetical protein [Novacetimonas hansenii]RFP02442.1 glycerol dehydrogenase [Novacetimonas hansenii]WEQ59600.1 glycerol dehydrogenase [Novacetimonas hansenii]CUW48809.1 Glycerol dehydrogenase small subunit [Novacetimonas hansenii]